MIIRHRHTWSHGCDCCCCNLDPLLFDLFPGAAAGYSVRRLSLTYEGAAMQVRRSSDNTTLDIGFVGEDLDTAALLAFAGAGSAFVRTWYDQSGGGFNMTEPVDIKQNQIVASGVLVSDNAFPIIRGVANGGFISTYTPNTGTKTLFSVGRQLTTSLSLFLCSDTGAGDYFYASESASAATPISLNVTTSSSFLNGSVWSPVTRGDVYNGLSNQFLATSMLGFNFANNLLGIGFRRSNPLNLFSLSLQELVIYPTDQSINRVAIESNINTYYNIY